MMIINTKQAVSYKPTLAPRLHIFFAVLFSLLVSSPSLATTMSSPIQLELTREFSSADANSALRYIEDKSGQLSLNEVREKAADTWQIPPNPSANFGFSQSVYWFKLALTNLSSENLTLYLHIDYALLDQINFYQVSGADTLQEVQVGDRFVFDQRPVDFPTFLLPFTLNAHTDTTLYLRVASEGTISVPVSVWSKEAFLLDSQTFLFIYGCFLSAMLIMGAYNFFLFLTLRDRSYLLYSLFILMATGVHSSLDGFSYQWFWPESPAWHQLSAVFFIAVGCFITTLFTQSLLPIPKRGMLRISITFLIILTACSAMMSLFLNYRNAAMLNGITTVITMSGVLIICLAMLRHSPLIARYFIVAWGIYFLGIVLKSSSNLGLIDSTLISEYAGNLGAVLGVLVMSLALAERINHERRAKKTAQEESINYLRKFQRLYETALEGIFTFNTQGQLISANPAFFKLMGVSDVASFNSQSDHTQGYRFSKERFDRVLTALRSKGQITEHETQITNQFEETTWVNISARLFADKQSGEEFIEGTLININARKTVEERLKHLADHDSLTGLVNRRAFETACKQRLEEVKSQHRQSSVLYLDLDQFKIVNDLCGHSAGDLLLKNLSHRLEKYINTLNGNHTIARLGGDEFGILLNDTTLAQAQYIAEKVRKLVDEFLFVWEGNRFSLGVSIGLVELLPFHISIAQVLVMADTACYLAKDQGRNRVHTFVESDQELQFRQLEMQWVSNIKQALSEDQFFLVFQHIASNHAEDTSFHYEILIRLLNQQGNLCAPGQFLPAAERYNLMPNIDRWVIQHYFSWLQQHPEHLANLATASINLSTESIGDTAFSVFLKQAFTEYAIPPEKICFEITESMAITHLDNTHSFIDAFHKLGCKFALDDFGTGFSSYAYLKELQVDYLKIDGIFIRNLCDDDVSLAMVKSINDVATAIGIETIAEFVETEHVKQKLIELGITYSQGYHVHKPVKLAIDSFESLTNTDAQQQAN
ncbi:MAG: EAL domain-containing protein [Oleiphilus sp.]